MSILFFSIMSILFCFYCARKPIFFQYLGFRRILWNFVVLIPKKIKIYQPSFKAYDNNEFSTSANKNIITKTILAALTSRKICELFQTFILTFKIIFKHNFQKRLLFIFLRHMAHLCRNVQTESSMNLCFVTFKELLDAQLSQLVLYDENQNLHLNGRPMNVFKSHMMQIRKYSVVIPDISCYIKIGNTS